MKFILFLFLSFNVQAGLLDFLHIKQANEAYQNEDYPRATEKFSQINTESARLNQGNSLYKQGLYEQSLRQYQKVKQKNLAFERLYNSGNAYLKLDKIDKAIASYEAALKLKKDKGALFNLRLIKKKKKQKKQDKDGKNKGSKDKKDGKNKQNSDKNKRQVDKINGIMQRRWEKKLYRTPKTLLIPLNKPQNNNDKNNKNLW